MENQNEQKSSGDVFIYRGYEVSVLKKDVDDKTPSWNSVDAITGKRIIFMIEDIPKELVVPILEHEVYEIEHNLDHESVIAVGRQKAKELGVLESFLSFEQQWEEIKKNHS